MTAARRKRKKFKAGVRRKEKTRIIPFVSVVLFVFIFMGFISFSKHTSASSENLFGRNKYYTCLYVESGDSLWNIANEYSSEEYENNYAYINEVMQINKLQSVQIKAGSRLCIPYYAEKPIC